MFNYDVHAILCKFMKIYAVCRVDFDEIMEIGVGDGYATVYTAQVRIQKKRIFQTLLY